MTRDELIYHLNEKLKLAEQNNWEKQKQEILDVLNHRNFPNNFVNWPLSPPEEAKLAAKGPSQTPIEDKI
jgi:hypothetical protein